MIQDTLKERGSNYGNFYTQANITQALTNIIVQHYNAVHTSEEEVNSLPPYMLEAIHMICHKLGRIANGNPYVEDSWHDIAGYAELVVDIIQQIKIAQKEAAEKEIEKQGLADNVTTITTQSE